MGVLRKSRGSSSRRRRDIDESSKQRALRACIADSASEPALRASARGAKRSFAQCGNHRVAPRRVNMRGPMPELTLYNYWRSSSSHRVRIALGAQGARLPLRRGEPARRRAVERRSTWRAARRATCRASSSTGSPYVESVAIVELLDERFPTPTLYPDDAARARARARARRDRQQRHPAAAEPPRHAVPLAGRRGAAPRGSQHFVVARPRARSRRRWQAREREGVRGPLRLRRRADGGGRVPRPAGGLGAALPRRRVALPARGARVRRGDEARGVPEGGSRAPAGRGEEA